MVQWRQVTASIPKASNSDARSSRGLRQMTGLVTQEWRTLATAADLPAVPLHLPTPSRRHNRADHSNDWVIDGDNLSISRLLRRERPSA